MRKIEVCEAESGDMACFGVGSYFDSYVRDPRSQLTYAPSVENAMFQQSRSWFDGDRLVGALNLVEPDNE